MTISAIIPARFFSTRFPGKPLVPIFGKSMIQHVYERVQRAKYVDEVLVATDDHRIIDEVESFGGKARMTSSDHQSGTDRIAEVAMDCDSQIVVNVQGDEPLVLPEVIDMAIEPLLKDPQIKVSTLKTTILEERELSDPNVVKVVTDLAGFALYFSRFPIPFLRDNWNDLASIKGFSQPNLSYRHIGLYVYRKEILLLFSRMEPSPLEKSEKLEQLRILENGYRIKVVPTVHDSIGVDVPEDILRVEKVLAEAE